MVYINNHSVDNFRVVALVLVAILVLLLIELLLTELLKVQALMKMCFELNTVSFNLVNCSMREILSFPRL